MRQPIQQVAYQPPAGRAGEVEAHTVADLLARAGQETFSALSRVEFHQVVFVTRGRVRHVVDFAAHDLAPGSVLWVRPGQVQQWGDLSAFDGHVLIFPAGLVDTATDRLIGVESAHGPTGADLSPRARARLEPLLDLLAEVWADDDLPRDLRATTLRHALTTLLLRLVTEAGDARRAPALPEPYLAFRDLVEEQYAAWHRVSDYAAALGWSARTLARATARAAGVPPKQVIDDRVLLEARRLLAHTDQPVHRVGAAVGFDDPSNFTAWFRQRAGVLPSEFRAAQRG